MSLCKACVSGVIHEGEAVGTIDNINGVKCYIGKPSVEYPKNKALLFLPDVFGLEFINNKLLVDAYAKNGFYTVLIDYFEGDSIPENALNDSNFDRYAWLAKHGHDRTKPLLDAAIKGLKEQGFETFAAIGYCFGAKYVAALAYDNSLKAGVMNHPSFLDYPTDPEKLKATKLPLLWNVCEIDDQCPLEKQKIVDEVYGDAEFYKKSYYPKASHGFAVRGDLTVPEVKFAKEDSFKQSVEWLIKHF
ncbi:alpha/beta-hydrolase [Atractiella rhizophila]|nr:alpha/beta-hydrolase [Atractiella rhizophila]